MARISRIQAVMTLSWDVLSTLTPVDYMKFRDVLGTSSGFQSAQFREIEFLSGLKDRRYLRDLAASPQELATLARRLDEPTVWDGFVALLEGQLPSGRYRAAEFMADSTTSVR